MGGNVSTASSTAMPSSNAADWSTVSGAFAEAEPVISPPDDLSRDVYCVLGMPVDAIDMATALTRIEAAAQSDAPYLISTPNLNFLVNSLTDPEFRQSLLLSDLSTADGMPIVWIARLLGIPIKARIAGSGIFEALASRSALRKRMGVFMFGGGEGVAEAAAQAMNAQASTVSCVGSLYPGFGTLDDMSNAEVIETINASQAGFLVVALGAAKGQSWLMRNHKRINVPVRAHLGAVINFQAGTVKRAPTIMQKLGLEWLWRIKEEPRLRHRYWADGKMLLRLLVTRVLPLVARAQMAKLSSLNQSEPLRVSTKHEYGSVTLKLSGNALDKDINLAIGHFRDALASATDQVVVDINGITAVDQRFLGLLLMMRKCSDKQGVVLKIVGASRSVERSFQLNEVDYLLTASGKRRPAVAREQELGQSSASTNSSDNGPAQGLLN